MPEAQSRDLSEDGSENSTWDISSDSTSEGDRIPEPTSMVHKGRENREDKDTGTFGYLENHREPEIVQLVRSIQLTVSNLRKLSTAEESMVSPQNPNTTNYKTAARSLKDGPIHEQGGSSSETVEFKRTQAPEPIIFVGPGMARLNLPFESCRSWKVVPLPHRSYCK